MINVVAAVGKNLELGKEGKLIWHITDDLKYFKNLTIYNAVVMGRKTYDSIGGPLENRINIVLTREDKKYKGAMTISDYKDILEIDMLDVFIIGGESVYKLFIPFAENLYLTEINDSCNDADTYFPSFDKDLYNKEVIDKKTYNDLEYSFVRYRKK